MTTPRPRRTTGTTQHDKIMVKSLRCDNGRRDNFCILYNRVIDHDIVIKISINING